METELPENLQLLSGCLEAWISAKEKLDCENKNHGTGFNPLNRIPINEKTHSEILGDLLNPKGSHGQGKLFLNVFLSHLGVPNPGPENGEWRVSVEKGSVEIGRADVMLYRYDPTSEEKHDPASVILIENKAKGAIDQKNQLYRYWHGNIHTRKSALDYQDPNVRRLFQIIYMPADGSKRPEKHSLMRPDEWPEESNPHKKVPLDYKLLSFEDFAEIINEKILLAIPPVPTIPPDNHRLRSFVTYYIEHFMKKGTLDTTISIFDSLEKWEAFLEMRRFLEKDEMIKQWLTVGAEKMQALYERNPSHGWLVEKWDNPYEFRWYLEDFGPDSVGIGFGFVTWQFHLHCKESGKYDQNKLEKIIESPSFTSLKSKFPDGRYVLGCFAGNKSFNLFPEIRQKEETERKYEMAWYAAHQGEFFAEKMLELVKEITESTELTALVRELNVIGRMELEK